MKKNMLQGTLFALITLLVPFLLTFLLNQNNSDLKLPNISNIQIFPSTGQSYPIDFDQYITGTLLATTPCSYEMETLKAQAIILRTYALKNMLQLSQTSKKSLLVEKMDTKNTGYTVQELGLPYLSSTDYLSNHTAKDYQVYLDQMEEAVTATKNKILTYKHNLITPLFFSTSAGTTRNSSELFSTSIPYLTSIDSNQDMESPEYMKISLYSQEALLQKLQDAYSNHSLGASSYDYQVYDTLPLNADTLFDSIQIIKRDSADYVLTISLGQVSISGEAFANTLSLNSSCFYFEPYEDQIRIICKGKGHGIGFSQYGANVLAKREGYTYDELLHHYYHNVKIQTLK